MAGKPGKKGKKGKKGGRVRSRNTNPHKIAEFNDLSPNAIVNSDAAGIRQAITALRQSLYTNFSVPSNYIAIIRIQPAKSASGTVFSANCGCGCS
jgi:hypothetical protein